jgi:hypothetical protein
VDRDVVAQGHFSFDAANGSRTAQHSFRRTPLMWSLLEGGYCLRRVRRPRR